MARNIRITAVEREEVDVDLYVWSLIEFVRELVEAGKADEVLAQLLEEPEQEEEEHK